MIDNWVTLDEEVIGSTYGMYWLTNENGVIALFKPDVSGNDYVIENTVKEIACFFDISYSGVLPYTYNGVDGFLSIKEDCKRYHRINGLDLYRNGAKYTSEIVSYGGTKYLDDIDYSIEGLHELVNPGCFEDICKVAFLDAICRNQDRHLGNIDFLFTLSGRFVSVAPLYDTVMSFSNSYSENALLGIDSSRTWKHKEVFQYLTRFNFMSEMFEKLKSEQFTSLCETLPFTDFLLDRRKMLTDIDRKNNLNKLLL